MENPENLNLKSALESSSVRQRLSGKQVLITGTTGFLGKVVLEKLIRTVPDIGGIHLLIRGNNRYPEARERFVNEIANSSVFECLRRENNAAFEDFLADRVHCITGEVTRPRFGLSPERFRLLASRLDATVNSAASVNFREELHKALDINTLCLENLSALAQLNKTMAFIQVSTCYVNGRNAGPVTESVIKPAGEAIPRSTAGYYEIDELLQSLQYNIAAARTRYRGRRLERELVELGIQEANRYGWSDTYTFTKWLGEQYLLKAMSGRSLTILRPSIIESALAEPSPGWIEGVKVADAIILAYARGKVFLFPGKRKAIIDVIPVDMVANSICLALAEAVSEPPQKRIYQCCSGSSNPISLGGFIDHLMAEARTSHADYPRLFSRQPKRPFIAVNRRLFDLAVDGMRLPLVVLGEARKLAGRKRELTALRNLDATRALATIFGFYTAPDYVFCNDSLMALANRMGERDKALFPVDARLIDWQRYLRKIHLGGLDRYALDDSRVHRPGADRARKKAA